MPEIAFPHVAWLRYFIRTGPGYDIDTEHRINGRVRNFEFDIRYHSAHFAPVVRFETVEAGREELDPLLEAWEVWWLVSQGTERIRFEFMAGDILVNASDLARSNARRKKSQPMPPTLSISVPVVPPSPEIAIDDLVRDLREQYEAAVASPRSVLLHAYAMYTRIELAYRGVKRAGVELNISDAALKRLKDFAHTRSPHALPRKFGRHTQSGRTIIYSQQLWISNMMREITLRCARKAAGQDPGKLLSSRP
jgi:hypothetical protein